MSRNFSYEDEFSLSDIVRVFKANKINILISPFLFASIALLFSWMFITPSYEAFGSIQTGQVAGKVLESGFVLEQRMKDKSFISDVIAAHPNVFNKEKDLVSEERYLQETLNVKKNKDVEIVSFSLKANSVQEAHLKAEAVVDTLHIAHAAIFDSNTSMIRQQIEMIDAQIALVREDDRKLQHNIAQSHGLNSYNAVVDSLVAKDRAEELRSLMSRKFELESSLHPAVSFNTKLLGKIYVSKEPVDPNLLFIGLVAFLVGIFSTIFAALLRDSLARLSS
ncbi:MAG: hypothetical protein RIR20_903 [Pseudomonadota bacterium]